MTQNPVKQQLQSGQPSLGTWLTIPSPLLAEVAASAGFDWVNIDMEHSAIDWQVAAEMLMAIRSRGPVPLIRVPWNTAENIKRALDAGAWGIIVPMVNSRAEAEAAVAAAKYPPQGIRSVGGGRHSLSFGTTPAEYYKMSNQETLVILMIEHIQGVERADEILSVPGVDAVFIGPSDLASSMGITPGLDREEPEFVAAIRHVRERAVALGVAPGIHASGGAGAARRIREGFRFVACASESSLMEAALRAELKLARE